MLYLEKDAWGQCFSLTSRPRTTSDGRCLPFIIRASDWCERAASDLTACLHRSGLLSRLSALLRWRPAWWGKGRKTVVNQEVNDAASFWEELVRGRLTNLTGFWSQRGETATKIWRSRMIDHVRDAPISQYEYLQFSPQYYTTLFKDSVLQTLSTWCGLYTLYCRYTWISHLPSPHRCSITFLTMFFTKWGDCHEFHCSTSRKQNTHTYTTSIYVVVLARI